jgi:hypothetical protein
MSYEYDFESSITIEQINLLGAENWQVKGVWGTEEEGYYDVLFEKGSAYRTLVENSTTGAEFYVQHTLTYGEGLILIFLTLFSVYLITKAVFKALFQDD